VLSLIVVPSFFLIMDNNSRPIARFSWLFIGPKDEAPSMGLPDAFLAGSGGLWLGGALAAQSVLSQSF